MEGTLTVMVADIRPVADGVRQLTLVPTTDVTLPRAEPGAHIVVHTPAGPRRAYSITEHTSAGAYVIAVARDDGGQGGSVSVHEDVHIGDVVTVSRPLNAFGLLDAPSYLLIAGGIGITPIRAMYRTLHGRARVQMLYLHRNRAGAAYAADFDTDPGVVLHESRTHGRYDLWSLLGEPDDATHVYCCASTSLMEEVRALTMHWNPAQIHFEDFSGVEPSGGAPFTVHWLPEDRTVAVTEHETLLAALRRAGIGIDSSCESGICGTCALSLVSGEVEHRDLVLDEVDHHDRIVSCVSRGVGHITVTPVAPGPTSDTPRR